jgi:hypothetical protein
MEQLGGCSPEGAGWRRRSDKVRRWKASEADAWAVGGRVCDTRAWTDETNGVRGRKIRHAGGGAVLKGSGGEGPGGVGAVWRRGGREREGDGGPRRGVEQCSGVASARQQPGVGATRVDVADRWAGMRRGPGHQRLGVA